MQRKIKHVLYIASLFPQPNASAAGVHTMSILHAFYNHMKPEKITFAAPQQTNNNAHAAALREQFPNCTIETVTMLPNNTQSMEKNAILQDANVCVFDTFINEEMFGWKVNQMAPHCMAVIDTVVPFYVLTFV